MWWQIRKLMLHKDTELKGHPFYLEDGAVPLAVYETPDFEDHPLTIMYMKPCDISKQTKRDEDNGKI